MDDGHHWRVQQLVALVSEPWERGNARLRNAIEVSLIEDLALGEINEQRRVTTRERLPRVLHRALVAINARWR
ncbi:MAG: hypothetical protein AAF333_01870 [Planctomycetota bacterium]